MTQPRPSGPKFKVTSEWLAWVKLRMDEGGVSQAELAEAAGVSQAAISDILRGESSETRVMPQINARLGGIPPTQVIVISALDEAKSVVDAHWDDLSDEEKAHVAATVLMFKRSRPGE